MIRIPDANRKAINLRLGGATYAEIGKELGVSRQRAQQMIRPPEAIGREIRKEFGYRCARCNANLQEERGDIHHKRTSGLDLKTYTSIDNLELLCIPCHLRAHRRKQLVFIKCRRCENTVERRFWGQEFCSRQCTWRFKRGDMPKRIKIEKETLTVRETAKLMHTPLMYVYHLLWAGTLKGEKIDGEWKISSRSVEERLAK